MLFAKKPGLTTDIEPTIFILASYLLVSNENVALSMGDFDYDKGTAMQYFPEYDIDLGAPLGGYSVENGVRGFEKGFVLVNPSDFQSKTYTLDRDYYKVISSGGAYVEKDGSWYGSLDYETVSGILTLPPVSGFVLLSEEDDETPMVEITKPKKNRLYTFNREVMPMTSTIVIGKITIEADASGVNGIDRVEFYINNKLKSVDDEMPYQWTWEELAVRSRRIKVMAYDEEGNIASDEINAIVFNI
jgi:hypothetical protein